MFCQLKCKVKVEKVNYLYFRCGFTTNIFQQIRVFFKKNGFISNSGVALTAFVLTAFLEDRVSIVLKIKEFKQNFNRN